MEDLVRPMSYKPNQEQTTRSNAELSQLGYVVCIGMKPEKFFHLHVPLCLQEHQNHFSRWHGGSRWHQRTRSQKLLGTYSAKIDCIGMEIRRRLSQIRFHRDVPTKMESCKAHQWMDVPVWRQCRSLRALRWQWWLPNCPAAWWSEVLMVVSLWLLVSSHGFTSFTVVKCLLQPGSNVLCTDFLKTTS